MAKPTIFTISAAWDGDASVWSGHCDDIPAAADAPTLDELLTKMSAMALDLLPDNHPDVTPDTLYLQITALREAKCYNLLNAQSASLAPVWDNTEDEIRDNV